MLQEMTRPEQPREKHTQAERGVRQVEEGEERARGPHGASPRACRGQACAGKVVRKASREDGLEENLLTDESQGVVAEPFETRGFEGGGPEHPAQREEQDRAERRRSGHAAPPAEPRTRREAKGLEVGPRAPELGSDHEDERRRERGAERPLERRRPFPHAPHHREEQREEEREFDGRAPAGRPARAHGGGRGIASVGDPS